MGRTKSYDRDVLIERAVDLFRTHGFASTSASMIEDTLGVNRSSVYAEFGSKQELFEIALERYRDTVVDHRFGPLEQPDAGLDSIIALLTFYTTAGDGPAAGKGCLLCNTAIELGPHDLNGATAGYFEQIETAFETALGNAVTNGELAESVDLSGQAQFLTATILGIYVLIRAAAPPPVIRAAATAAAKQVEALRRT